MKDLVNTAVASKLGQTTSFVICLNLPLPKENKNLVYACLMHHISFEMHVGKAHLGSGMSIKSIFAKTSISTLTFDPYLSIFSCYSNKIHIF